jgi:hypothetical protein
MNRTAQDGATASWSARAAAPLLRSPSSSWLRALGYSRRKLRWAASIWKSESSHVDSYGGSWRASLAMPPRIGTMNHRATKGHRERGLLNSVFLRSSVVAIRAITLRFMESNSNSQLQALDVEPCVSIRSASVLNPTTDSVMKHVVSFCAVPRLTSASVKRESLERFGLGK